MKIQLSFCLLCVFTFSCGAAEEKNAFDTTGTTTMQEKKACDDLDEDRCGKTDGCSIIQAFPWTDQGGDLYGGPSYAGCYPLKPSLGGELERELV